MYYYYIVNYGVLMVMSTVQIRLTPKQIRMIDLFVRKGSYPNRSEAVRDAVRKLVTENNVPQR